MANVYAVKSGNWSDTTVWNTGALPTSADDVYSNNFTVTVDISPTVLSINNTSTAGVSAGGSFSFTSASNGITLTCTSASAINQGSATTVLNSTIASPLSVTFSGSLVQGQIGFSASLVSHSGTGTLNINGNLTGPNYNSGGQQGKVLTQTNGTINVTGNVTSGNSNSSNSPGTVIFTGGILNITGTITGSTASGGANAYPGVSQSGGTLNVFGNVVGGNTHSGVLNTSGTTNVTGSVLGGTGSTGYGVNLSSGGTVTITGTSTSGTAGPAYANNSTGAINHTGSAIAGTTNAFVNNSTGTITHIGTAQASATAPAIGAGAVGQVTILTGPLLSTDASYTGAASSGVNPCVALRWFPANTALSTFEYRMRGQTVAGSPSARPARQMFLTDAYDATYPTAANVRSGTAYGPSSIYTGTCAVPAAASVVVGAAVDNTVGTAAITAATIRSAVGLASANLDTQLSGITSGISGLPSASAIASAVWAAATRTLTTAIDNSSTIAAAVWSYATGRTITGGTVDTLTNAPTVPSAASIASQVRTELTPELARVANCATTQEVDDIVEGALS